MIKLSLTGPKEQFIIIPIQVSKHTLSYVAIVCNKINGSIRIVMIPPINIFVL